MWKENETSEFLGDYLSAPAQTDDHKAGGRAWRLLGGFAVGLSLLVSATPQASYAQATVPADAQDALDSATDVYLYGYPLVTFDMVRAQNTNVAVSGPENAPMGQMIKMRSYPAVDNHCCAAPNADTLYTMAWFDVSSEPWIVSMPDMGDRYYILPFIDGWSEVISVASQPLNGGAAQSYAITGPNWSGTLPDNIIEVKSPTAMVWLLGRIYSTGTDDDYKQVHDLQDAFDLRPLSALGQDWTPPTASVDPAIDMKTSVRAQVNGMDAEAYFNRLAQLMETNPPAPQDTDIVDKMNALGIVAGAAYKRSPDLTDEQLATVPKQAQMRAGLRLKKTPTQNGWLFFTDGVGNWGTDYELRAMANLLGPGWNRPSDAIYPISQMDAQGKPYDGANHDYVIRLDADKMPPAKAFWSLTIYDADMFFVPNPVDRYAVGSHTPLTQNPDGSIDILVQATSPGADKETNWLPAPKGPFQLVLRLYDPETDAPSILNGSWTPPAVQVVE